MTDLFSASVGGFFPFLARMTLFFTVRSIVVVSIGFAFIRLTSIGRNRRIFKLNYGANQLKKEALTMVKIIPYYAFLISIATYFNLIHFVPSSLVGHMNVEVFPAGFGDSKIGKWLNTPTYHSLHHGRVREHYGLLTTIPDRLFGTYFQDCPLIQTRAAQGNGLTKVSERIAMPEKNQKRKRESCFQLSL